MCIAQVIYQCSYTFTSIYLNFQLQESTEEPPKKKKKKGKRENVIPDPVEIDVSKVNTADLEVAGTKFRLFRSVMSHVARLVASLKCATRSH